MKMFYSISFNSCHFLSKTNKFFMNRANLKCFFEGVDNNDLKRSVCLIKQKFFFRDVPAVETCISHV